mmetsp:Transcript_43313/g.98817  ORF Transcript_43313/g.98817 Transcript_43313/m.98817 type:complete len:206 (+) Transcript_43313:74-691(+)
MVSMGDNMMMWDQSVNGAWQPQMFQQQPQQQMTAALPMQKVMPGHCGQMNPCQPMVPTGVWFMCPADTQPGFQWAPQDMSKMRAGRRRPNRRGGKSQAAKAERAAAAAAGDSGRPGATVSDPKAVLSLTAMVNAGLEAKAEEDTAGEPTTDAESVGASSRDSFVDGMGYGSEERMEASSAASVRRSAFLSIIDNFTVAPRATHGA